MKIGKQQFRTSAISTANADAIVVRGKSLVDDLIGRISFTEYFHLLVTGERATAQQTAMLDATLVAIAEHGLVPSVQAARMTLAAAPDAVQGAVAAGILGCGSVILGAAESAGRLFADVVARSGGPASLGSEARQAVESLRGEGRAIPGYGHPLHSTRDPRTHRLLLTASSLGLAGRHVAAALAIEQAIPDVVGRPLPLNVSGTIAATLLDADFPLRILKGIPILARTAGLLAHVAEELDRPIGFVLSHHAQLAIGYDGTVPPGFLAEEAVSRG